MLADADTVELTNLQRQIVHRQSSLGRLKVASARDTLAEVNPLVDVLALPQRLAGDALGLAVAQADVVLDCSDNFPTRHAVNRACVVHRKPLVSGAAVRFDGQFAVFDPRVADSPCYRCLFGEEGDASDGPCATFGVFAPLVGIIGSMQAAEALKLLIGMSGVPLGKLQTLDLRTHEWRTLRFRRDPKCPVCADTV
jgi:adenylyltransferase/sulfurtransferase